MIPSQNIVAWGAIAPWAEQRQIEQDLIISRAIVDIFSDEMLRKELRFRGGTALNKLHFPKPLRYSEDIDLVRTTNGPIGPILDQLRVVLEPWLGQAKFDQSPVAPKFLFRVEAEDGSGVLIRLKLEINTREIDAFDGALELPFEIENPWFAARTTIPTFTREEMLATKFRALLQRDKGRDLYDLAHGLEVFEGIDLNRLVEVFLGYLALSEQKISRAQAQQRMFAKMANPRLLLDMRPLLPAAEAESLTEKSTFGAIQRIFADLVDQLSGDPWARTDEMKERFEIDW